MIVQFTCTTVDTCVSYRYWAANNITFNGNNTVVTEVQYSQT